MTNEMADVKHAKYFFYEWQGVYPILYLQIFKDKVESLKGYNNNEVQFIVYVLICHTSTSRTQKNSDNTK